ncbi:MAG: hypothetical protein PHU95_02285 [Candidatus Thermoplasmatota archaeon]|nr:hypothetical protein [Candidatus Thermoplasmatota archaeon]MDD5778260.1 hypothetical protein [Candidatus Thermoplasmatota archaeon]
MTYTTGIYFGVSKERQLEIGAEIMGVLEETGSPEAVEQHLAENISGPGEAYVAGFILCYQLVQIRRQEDTEMRDAFRAWLEGYNGPDPFSRPLPVQIAQVVMGRDPGKPMRDAVEATVDYLRKKQKKEDYKAPEVL